MWTVEATVSPSSGDETSIPPFQAILVGELDGGVSPYTAHTLGSLPSTTFIITYNSSCKG